METWLAATFIGIFLNQLLTIIAMKLRDYPRKSLGKEHVVCECGRSFIWAYETSFLDSIWSTMVFWIRAAHLKLHERNCLPYLVSKV